MDVLINHPLFGSLWLVNAEYKGDYVEGDVEDSSSVTGYSPMWFPKTCIRKVEK